MTLTELTESINEQTGWTGPRLEAAVHFSAMLFAELVGDKRIADHFETRMKEAAGRIA